jgi:hypothetical protein
VKRLIGAFAFERSLGLVLTTEADQCPLPHVTELSGLDELPGPTFPRAAHEAEPADLRGVPPRLAFLVSRPGADIYALAAAPKSRVAQKGRTARRGMRGGPFASVRA